MLTANVDISSTIILTVTRISFSSFWKWVMLSPSSEKMGNATPYANKKWVACSDNKIVFNKHETHATSM